jgi:carbonic anhydrase
MDAAEALRTLRAGNERFVRGTPLGQSANAKARAALVDGQAPIAIILSCSDSRVPSEMVFDQGLGDLFVIRIAGNIVAPSIVGSVEFAATAFGSRLVVVMGHSRCGAIAATAQAILEGTGQISDNVRDIVERCKPGVETVIRTAGNRWAPEIEQEAIRANVRHSCSHLRHGSRVLERMRHEDGLRVVGAEYMLETGQVDFFDGLLVTGERTVAP